MSPIHPQSTIHSLVEYIDGSILAQISVTDMRLPILYALAYPERPVSNLTFDLAQLAQLDFAQPDTERFPCLRLAYEAAAAGPSACIALNAADEIAVGAFLEGRINFPGIARTIERVLELTAAARPQSISEVLAADEAARACARQVIAADLFRRKIIDCFRGLPLVVSPFSSRVQLHGGAAVRHCAGHYGGRA